MSCESFCNDPHISHQHVNINIRPATEYHHVTVATPPTKLSLISSLIPKPKPTDGCGFMTDHLWTNLCTNMDFLRRSLGERRAERVAAGSFLREKRSCSHARRSSLNRIFLCTRLTWKSGSTCWADCERVREGGGGEGGRGEEERKGEQLQDGHACSHGPCTTPTHLIESLHQLKGS